MVVPVGSKGWSFVLRSRIPGNLGCYHCYSTRVPASVDFGDGVPFGTSAVFDGAGVEFVVGGKETGPRGFGAAGGADGAAEGLAP
jgi:hypothetical protein